MPNTITSPSPLEADKQPLSHGFLVLDKPYGISSAKAVSDVKRLLKCAKIGHGGTLDPLASGILPLAIGEATKAFDYVASATKQYRFTTTFGEERTTGDAEGEATATCDYIPMRATLEAVLPAFTGTIMQTPPVYSALNVGGKRAYELARQGQEVQLEARPIEIHQLELVSFADRTATFGVTCGKGTYIRSLAQDIARKCNSLGYVSMLRRTSVGKFTENMAISLDNLREVVHNAAPLEAWLSIELALDDIPAINLDANETVALRHGKQLRMDKPDGTYMGLHQGKIVALAEVKNATLRSKRIFNC
ncbi:MAG TPA: tRNA pseudouridine(55) synthase TruB [Rickettsiales bacterium]|nr:tRNA pseudouridine(55) synthase TruB [Rickettsiales bacterium]